MYISATVNKDKGKNATHVQWNTFTVKHSPAGKERSVW